MRFMATNKFVVITAMQFEQRASNVACRQAEPKNITPRRLIVSINFLSEQPPSSLKVARPYAQKQCSDCFCVGRLRLNMCQVIS